VKTSCKRFSFANLEGPGEFNVDDVEEVKWDYSPYDNLVLPEGEKDLVLAFADRPQQKKQGFDDFVSDKGGFLKSNPHG